MKTTFALALSLALIVGTAVGYFIGRDDLLARAQRLKNNLQADTVMVEQLAPAKKDLNNHDLSLFCRVTALKGPQTSQYYQVWLNWEAFEISGTFDANGRWITGAYAVKDSNISSRFTAASLPVDPNIDFYLQKYLERLPSMVIAAPVVRKVSI